jgi:hypothetical protein
MTRFEDLMEYVGDEDELIQADRRSGAVPARTRKDYATGIGISKYEEDIVISILLKGYRQGGGPGRPLLMNKLTQQYGLQEAHERWELPLRQAVDELKAELTPEAFAKLNLYVRGVMWLPHPTPGPFSDPCPRKDNPAPGEISHLACAETFFTYVFDDVSYDDTYNKRLVEKGNPEGKEPMHCVLLQELPEGPREAATELGIEAHREIQEQYDRIYAFWDKYWLLHPDTRLEDAPTEIRAEIQAMEDEEPGIRERYVAKLREIVGDEYFDKLDRYLFNEEKRDQKAGAMTLLNNPK